MTLVGTPHARGRWIDLRVTTPMQVLILTTDAAVRRRVLSTVKRFGCEPLEPATLHAATETLENVAVALVLCDPALPATSPADIVARFRSTAHGRDARIVALGPTTIPYAQLTAAGFDDLLAYSDDRALELYIAATRREHPARLQAARERQRAETLRRLSLDLAWSTTVEQQAQHALDAVRKVLPVRGAAIWLRNRLEGDVACTRTIGLSPAYETRAAPYFKVMSGRQWLALTRAPEIYPDARAAPPAIAAMAPVEGFAGVAHLALFTPTQVLGVLAVYVDEPGGLSTERIELLQMVAATTAMAIDQTQLRGRLGTAETRLRAVLEHVPDGVFLQDAQGNLLMTNRAMEMISGYAATELELLNVADLFDPAGAARIRQRVAALLAGEDAPHAALDLTLVRANERLLHVDVHFALLPQDDLTGQLVVQGIVRDIDAVVRAKRELETHQAIAEVVAGSRDFDAVLTGVVATLRDRLDYARGGIWTRSETGDTFQSRARFGAADAGVASRLRAAARDRRTVWEPLADDGSEGRAICVPILAAAELIGVLDIEADERRPLTARDRAFLESIATHIAGSLERARLHDELTRLALTDQVTDLPNRRRLRAELERVVATSDQPVSLLIVGIDGFKAVNDTYGDATGDEVLRQVGQVLGARIRPPRLLARHTGDQFVVLLPGVGRDEAVQVAEDLRIAVATHLFTAAEQVEQLTVSIGAATWPDEARGAHDLMAAAAHALYLAKQAGRNQVFQSNAALAELAPAHGRIRDLLRQSPAETLALLVRAMDQRLPGRAGHAERVAAYAAEIARRLGIPEHEIEDLRVAAHVHDIGMLTLPDSLLRKPGRLSAGERELLRGVPRAAYGMLVQLNLPDLVLQSVVHQHERWDGTGYPTGLAGDDIPLGARIIAIADALDAMTSARAHRDPMPLADALEEIRRQAGKQFDPDVVEAAAALADVDLSSARDDLTMADIRPADLAVAD